ncbi:hypothetical protein BU26DRAFT_546594 [Trematosphaeria pertusa]|uniref:Uncharacterized protein n=1 Tax=Trematosphaeria pertusa TaxID=390896 RepID=A0A6A6IUR9_9PLEO|nr:uncharacterized protein BU26DRAFT_546594 [Trematosphaeria pertusa]KAF2254315.1 hypothetical protein BU26DRAFT_546594 [Trematosphaeria pertusa]
MTANVCRSRHLLLADSWGGCIVIDLIAAISFDTSRIGLSQLWARGLWKNLGMDWANDKDGNLGRPRDPVTGNGARSLMSPQLAPPSTGQISSAVHDDPQGEAVDANVAVTSREATITPLTTNPIVPHIFHSETFTALLERYHATLHKHKHPAHAPNLSTSNATRRPRSRLRTQSNYDASKGSKCGRTENWIAGKQLGVLTCTAYIKSRDGLVPSLGWQSQPQAWACRGTAKQQLQPPATLHPQRRTFQRQRTIGQEPLGILIKETASKAITQERGKAESNTAIRGRTMLSSLGVRENSDPKRPPRRYFHALPRERFTPMARCAHARA